MKRQFESQELCSVRSSAVEDSLSLFQPSPHADPTAMRSPNKAWMLDKRDCCYFWLRIDSDSARTTFMAWTPDTATIYPRHSRYNHSLTSNALTKSIAR
nr:hypothetical protein CFP56_62190 [Quercus suber]